MSGATNPSHKPLNWPAYDNALRGRGSLTIWFDPDMVRAAKPTGNPGRQRFAIWSVMSSGRASRMPARMLPYLDALVVGHRLFARIDEATKLWQQVVQCDIPRFVHSGYVSPPDLHADEAPLVLAYGIEGFGRFSNGEVEIGKVSVVIPDGIVLKGQGVDERLRDLLVGMAVSIA